MTPVQRANFDAWLVALRSGEYQQGTGLLRSASDHYCCLGVAAQIAEVPCSLKTRDEAYDFDFGGFKNISLPTNGWFEERFGLDNKLIDVVAQMNDGNELGGKRYSFNEIADYIERVAPAYAIDDPRQVAEATQRSEQESF